MEDLEAAVETEIAAEQSKPVQLAEAYLNAGTLRYAATNVNLVFPTGGNTYTAIAFYTGNKKVTRGGQIIEMEYQFDDRNEVLHGYNAAERFDGKPFIGKEIYRDALGAAANYRERINGFMEEPRFDKEWMYLKVIDGKALGRKTLNEYFQRPCNNLFGNAKCNKDGLADLTTLKATGMADSGTVSTLVDNALTQADDYWNFGRIEITISGIVYYRKVIDFDAATDTVTFDVPLHTAVAAGNAYTVYKGCPLTWEACQATYAYGPSGDNKANFIGFIHLLRKE